MSLSNKSTNFDQKFYPEFNVLSIILFLSSLRINS